MLAGGEDKASYAQCLASGKKTRQKCTQQKDEGLGYQQKDFISPETVFFKEVYSHIAIKVVFKCVQGHGGPFQFYHSWCSGRVVIRWAVKLIVPGFETE